MRPEKFSESLNNIDDKYIEEAASYSAASENSNKAIPKSFKAWRIIAIAACALLAVGIAGVGILLAGNARSSYKNESYEYAPDAEYEGAISPDANSYATDGGMVYDGANAAYEDSYEEGVPDPQEQKDAGAGTGVIFENDMPENANAKMIYTAHMTISTTEFEEACKEIESSVKTHGGYCENMEVSNSQSSYRSASYIMRIPSENLDAFLKDADKFGAVGSISKNAEDVSSQYYDIETRLETEKAKLARLNELLAEASDISDMLVIEDEIFETQRTIDELSGNLKMYDSKVDYSTVTIDLKEVYKITEGDNPLTFSERISQAFKNGIDGFGNFLEELAIWFASAWIWVVIVLVVIAAVVVILVKVLKKKYK